MACTDTNSYTDPKPLIKQNNRDNLQKCHIQNARLKNNDNIVEPVLLTDFMAKLGQCHLCLEKATLNWLQEQHNILSICGSRWILQLSSFQI